MELLREWQLEQVVPAGALMGWVEDEAVLAVARVEAPLPVVHLELARAEVGPAHRAVQPELARAEAPPWDPTYRVIRKYPPRTEAWELLVQVVVEARQQPWVRRTRPVRTVKRKR